MPSKRAEPRSIASQLVILFTAAAALLLFAGLGALSWIAVHHAFKEDKEVLDDKVLALEAMLQARGGLSVVNDQLNVRHNHGRSVYWIRVLDAADHVVGETPQMSAMLPPAVFAPPRDRVSALLAPTDYRVGDKLFSLVSVLSQFGSERYVLQVAQDRSIDNEFAEYFSLLLAGAVILGTLASAVIAVTVTKRGLRPLAAITQSLKRIGPAHLDRRVAPASWPREIQPLAIAFDDMLDRLEDSFTRLSQFSADLAHELRTPINNIMGEAQVALTKLRTPEEYRAVIESSVSECEELAAIVDNLLFLARAESSASPVHRSRLDGHEAMEKIASYYEPIAEDQEVTVSCEGEGALEADPLLFSRALSNLVENALRFTPAGGSVRIRLVETPAATEVSVQDTGAGIAAEHLPRIFDRFYQVDRSRSSSHGAGLGLSLVKSIMTMHGGSVAVQSEVGRGTTMTLQFPRDQGSVT